jgi:predicted phosphoadenosine phosphosulfate sulfurtransferase
MSWLDKYFQRDFPYYMFSCYVFSGHYIQNKTAGGFCLRVMGESNTKPTDMRIEHPFDEKEDAEGRLNLLKRTDPKTWSDGRIIFIANSGRIEHVR